MLGTLRFTLIAAVPPAPLAATARVATRTHHRYSNEQVGFRIRALIPGMFEVKAMAPTLRTIA